MGLEDVTHTQCTALRPPGAGRGEPGEQTQGSVLQQDELLL